MKANFDIRFLRKEINKMLKEATDREDPTETGIFWNGYCTALKDVLIVMRHLKLAKAVHKARKMRKNIKK